MDAERGAGAAGGGRRRPDITVAVPTYNRIDSVGLVLDDVLAPVEAGELAALVVDDGSTDGTFERLAPRAGPGVRVLRNEENLGYAGTLCRILREVDTEWLVVSADDDRLDLGRLDELIAWLHAEQPDFVSTQWRKQGGGLYRGRATSGPMGPRDLLAAASHAPGLLYRTAAARSALPLLEQQLAERSDAAMTYPQLVIAAHLIASGRAAWWAGTIVVQGAALPSGINDHAGRHYSDPASRLSQGLAFDRLYRQMEAAAPDDGYRRCARQWQRWNERNLYPSIRSSLLQANPGADGRRLDASARRYLLSAPWRGVAERVRALRSR